MDSPFNAVTRSQKKMYYDANGNLIKEMQSNNADDTAVMTFDTVEYAYDCMNNFTDVITHVSASEKNYVHYEYDVAGQMTKMVTGLSSPYVEGSTAGNVTEYAYDLDGNCISVTDALDNTEYYTYNHNRVVTSATDRNGTVSEFTYNALGSPLTEEYYQNDELVYSKEYTYDDAGRLIDNGYDIYYMYDERGRVITEFQGDHIIDYSYDDRGRKSERILWADGQYDVSTTTYTYDLMSRLTEVSNSSMPTATRNTYYTYTPNGQLLTETTGGLVTSYEYNDAGLTTQKTHSVNGTDPLSNFCTSSNYFTYSYYTNGYIKSMFDTANIVAPSYTYDGAGRLIQEIRQGSGIDDVFSYTYDAAGNRLSKVSIYNANEGYGTTITETELYSYDANNRLTSVSVDGNVVNYTYDSNGNMLTEGNKNYTYNVLNQLIGYSDETSSATYSYYSTGLRSSKNVNNSDIRGFVWDGSDLIYEYGLYQSPYLGKCYNYGLDLISSYDNNEINGILYEKDDHGSVVMTIGLNNNYDQRHTYDAFGISGEYQYSTSDPMRYCGEYQDYESGLIYLRARYYSPKLGRFINEDPIRDGLNWYVYCNNNPVRFVDPSGTADIALGLVGLGGASAADGLLPFGEIIGGLFFIVCLFIPAPKAEPNKPLTTPLPETKKPDVVITSSAEQSTPSVETYPQQDVEKATVLAEPQAEQNKPQIITSDYEQSRLTTKALTAIAATLGYQKTNYKSNGEAVYYNNKDKTYITYDNTAHIVGGWKMAKSPEALGSKETRTGTYTLDLKRVGD